MMRVLNIKRIDDEANARRGVEANDLRHWLVVVLAEDWTSAQEVKSTFPLARQVSIVGWEFPLVPSGVTVVASIDFPLAIVMVEDVV